jgi:hypothetical protein
MKPMGLRILVTMTMTMTMAIAAIAGCTSTTGGSMPSSSASANGRQAVLLTYHFDSSLPHHDASISGELGISASGCVTIADFVIVAPDGSTIVGDRVHLELITDAAIGERVEAVGGLVDVLTIAADSRPPGYQQCGARELAFISPP